MGTLWWAAEVCNEGLTAALNWGMRDVVLMGWGSQWSSAGLWEGLGLCMA